MKTPLQRAIADACNAQTLTVEGVENLAAYGFQHLEEAEQLFHAAAGKLVAARAAVRDAIRERDALQNLRSAG